MHIKLPEEKKKSCRLHKNEDKRKKRRVRKNYDKFSLEEPIHCLPC